MSTPKSAKILVTLPIDLHERVQAKAESMRRSLSGYVAYVLDRELPPPTSLGSFLDAECAKELERLEACIDTVDGHRVVFVKDSDGILQPFTIDQEGYPTLKQVARSCVLQRLAVATTKDVPFGAVHKAKSEANSTGWTECHNWYKDQGIAP